MKKNIKDYLHLYLGCRVKTTGGKYGTLVSVSKETCVVVYDNEDPRGSVVLTDAVKPILRPLSDKTEVEKAMVGSRLKATNESYEFERRLQADKTLYLLTKHFDLFGLIEAGLAIDKTKQA